MTLIEIACPAGALDEHQRQSIAETVLGNFLVEPDAPPQAIERAARGTHVWFHDMRTGTSGAGRYRTDGPIPFRSRSPCRRRGGGISRATPWAPYALR